MTAPGNLLGCDLHENSRILIHGLTSGVGAELNLKAGKIVREEENGRWGVQVLGGKSASKPVLLKRMNMLSATYRQDREIFVGLLTLHYAPELRAARPALNNMLNEDIGLLLLIASYVTHRRQCLFQFGGFMAQIWEENWCYADPAKPLKLAEKPARRLDAACCDLGLGRLLFAGGCGDHPRRCRLPEGFFKTAEVYDSLTDEWTAISDMPTRRHGSTACRLGPNVYVLGGAYVDESSAPIAHKFCDVFHIDSATWTTLPPSDYEHVQSVDFQQAAFFGACSVAGRIVALLDGVTIAYNPATSDGWRVVGAEASVEVGHSSCAAEYEGELVVASGRPRRYARSAAAFGFSAQPADAEWWRGSWRQLPSLAKARVGGSLAVVYGKLYITGGVDERSGEFRNDAERLDQDQWVSVPWFQMPRALHAHETHAMPYLHPSAPATARENSNKRRAFSLSDSSTKSSKSMGSDKEKCKTM